MNEPKVYLNNRIKSYVTVSILMLCSLFSFGQNNPPEPTDDNYTTNINTTLNVDPSDGLLQNDTDTDGDSLVVTDFNINASGYSAGQTATISDGDITINANGSFTFMPTTDFTGDVPPINYTISDGTDTSTAIVYLSVYQPPVANDDYDTADINTTLDVPASGVLDNDTFDDQTGAIVTSFTINGTNYTAGATANLSEGDFTLAANGSYKFEPAPGNKRRNVPNIKYTISDGTETSTATLFLTVEEVDDLIQFENLSSCNQGFTPKRKYKIRYNFEFKNTSKARDYHPSSMINNIQITKDLDAIYGTGCVISIDEVSVTTSNAQDFVGNPYPLDFSSSSVNPNFLDGTSNNLFSSTSFNNAILYPRQTVNISYCVTVDPFCGGRPKPTPSRSGVDFEAVLEIKNPTGNVQESLLLEDFHTTEAIITAGLSVPENEPLENPDGTYDYMNSVIIKNEGNAVAKNVNFNMGLGDFFNNGITFKDISITQTSGPFVTINNNYDGDTNTNTLLLKPNNSLAPGETIVLEISHKIASITDTGKNNFNQVVPSQTQGPLDGFDEYTDENRKKYTYAIWEDNLGSHLDRYYASDGSSVTNDQCGCGSLNMSFFLTSSVTANKAISEVNPAPNGILEHEELTFEINISNTSDVVDLDNLQVEENFQDICQGSIVSFTSPEIISSTATTDPNLNPNFDGVTDTNIFDGVSGLLKTGENLTIQFTLVLAEDCIGTNTISFTATDPLGKEAKATAGVDVEITTDSDDDGISNVDDIDDDNDAVPGILEYDGIDPLGDHDDDLIPNYRDTDYGSDDNNDGVVDSFDFDDDGIPNHFDLDADNDGLFDILEVGNAGIDTNGDGQTNNPVGQNGLDNTIETSDTGNAGITYTLVNTDNDSTPDFLDIDADADGIVDNIEAQPTDSYIPPDNTHNDFGVDTAYAGGLSPVDTDEDSLPDYVDINSDDDTRDDDIEGWDFNNDGTPETVASGIDADSDGLDDAYDNDDASVNPTNGQLPIDFPNADYDVTSERDWREIMAVVVAIDDVSDEEGNDLEFTISLVQHSDNTIPVQSTTPVEMTLLTTDGTTTTGDNNTALSPFDYGGISDVQIEIPALTDTFEFSITSFDDDIFELDELFTLNAEVISDNTVNTEVKGIGIIENDELPPDISMNNDMVKEGENLEYTIELSRPSSIPTEISIESADFTATSPDDYKGLSEVFTIDGTFDPSKTNLSTSFSIPTFEDNLNETDEEVLDIFGEVVSTDIGVEELTKTGTIIDIDPNPLVVISNDTVVEGNTLSFTISLLSETGEPVENSLPINFDLETEDITTTANKDYLSFSKSTSIPAFQTSLTIEVETLYDGLDENTETMRLRASIASGTVANTSSLLTGTGTIKDNDVPNLFSPNGDGSSDVFKIDGLEVFPNFELTIFDRNGGKIYDYNNNGNTSPRWWDGTHNGDAVVEGVYFYLLDYNDGSTKPRTGFIQLVR